MREREREREREMALANPVRVRWSVGQQREEQGQREIAHSDPNPPGSGKWEMPIALRRIIIIISTHARLIYKNISVSYSLRKLSILLPTLLLLSDFQKAHNAHSHVPIPRALIL